MKKLSELVERVSLRDLVEALASTISDTEVQPEPEAEGEEEFVKVHKTEKHAEPYGNKKASDATKKDTSAAGKEPKKGFPPEVKEAKNWFHKVGATTPNDEKKKEPSKKTKGDAYSRAEEKSKHVWHKDEKMTREETELDEAEQLQLPSDSKKSWKWKKTEPSKKTRGKYKHPDSTMQNPWMWKVKEKLSVENEETELDESGAIGKHKQTMIKRPKFDSRGNVILTKTAKDNITHGKPSRKLSGRAYSSKKAFGEEKEQLDELSKSTLKSYVKKAAKDIGKRSYHAGVSSDLEGGMKDLEKAEKHEKYIPKAVHRIAGRYYPKHVKTRNPTFGGHRQYKGAWSEKELTDPKTGERYPRKKGRTGPYRANESVEQLDELKKDTLGSYISKAVPSKKSAEEGLKTRTKHGLGPGALSKIAKKRDTGIDRAAQRLGGTYEVGKPVKVMIPGRDDNDPGSGPYTMKRKKLYHAEETEQLDELSKKTLGRVDYAARKKSKDLEKQAMDVWEKRPKAEKTREKIYDKADKARTVGQKARDRIHKRGAFKFYKTDERKNKEILDRLNWEETEQLDEAGLSKQRLSAYVPKAKKSAEELTKVYQQKTKEVGPKNYSPEGLKSLHKAQRREKGIHRAEARMRGERDVESTGEISQRYRDEKKHPFKNFFKSAKKRVHDRYYKPYNVSEEQIDEKAVSKAQQRLFGIALATRRGETDRGGKEATRLAADLPAKELRKFAKTKHKGLPERKESK